MTWLWNLQNDLIPTPSTHRNSMGGIESIGKVDIPAVQFCMSVGNWAITHLFSIETRKFVQIVCETKTITHTHNGIQLGITTVGGWSEKMKPIH